MAAETLRREPQLGNFLKNLRRMLPYGPLSGTEIIPIFSGDGSKLLGKTSIGSLRDYGDFNVPVVAPGFETSGTVTADAVNARSVTATAAVTANKLVVEDGAKRISVTASMHNLNSTYALGWCNTDDGTAGNQDVSLRRDDAKILAVRSDKPNTDHTLRVYNNYKSSTDFERAAVGWTTTVNVLTIGSQNAGTGVARDVHLVAGNNRVALLNQNYLQIDKILKLPVQSAPSSPQDGDIWRQDNTVTGLKIRVAGATRTITVT